MRRLRLRGWRVTTSKLVTAPHTQSDTVGECALLHCESEPHAIQEIEVRALERCTSARYCTASRRRTAGPELIRRRAASPRKRLACHRSNNQPWSWYFCPVWRRRLTEMAEDVVGEDILSRSCDLNSVDLLKLQLKTRVYSESQRFSDRGTQKMYAERRRMSFCA